VTSKEAKQLIGRAIKYAHTGRLFVRWYYATVIDVKGKNVEIDRGGMRDWLWLPDVKIVPIAPEIAPISGKD
jgi:hypothetical protein